MMACLFVSNHENDAVGQAVQQTIAGGWRGVYRRAGGLFEVHDEKPKGAEFACMALIVDGMVSFLAGTL